MFHIQPQLPPTYHWWNRYIKNKTFETNTQTNLAQEQADKVFDSWFAGPQNGLSLILNVEQYEYMRGPQIDAGVKVNKQ